MMDEEPFYASIWRDLRAPEPNLVVRASVSLMAGLVLAAVTVLGLWAWAHLIRSPGHWIRDEELAVAALAGSTCWFAALIGIWRPMQKGRAFVLPSIVTLAIGVGVIAGSIAIDVLLRVRDEEVLMFSLALVGGAALILTWLPTARRLLRGRPVLGADHQVRVRCPTCGYSLIGLRDLRCPECGTTFTIDELIRAQGYGGVPKVSADEPEEDNKPPRLRREPSSQERETG